MTRAEILKHFPNAKESFIRLNVSPGGLENPQREHHQRRQSKDPALAGSPTSLGYCVSIISLRLKLVDGHDNLRTGAKPLVDAIANTLGFSNDSDERLTWEYFQFRTEGEEATLVKIQPVETKAPGGQPGR